VAIYMNLIDYDVIRCMRIPPNDREECLVILINPCFYMIK